MSSPRVSILIPTLDGERDLERLLPTLAALRVEGGLEIRAIDSSSTDRSVALLEGAGAQVEIIDRARFSHSGTRNQLARGASGELLLFLSQDALPVGTDFLERLVECFDADPTLAGATARVLPHGTDDALTRRTVLEAPEAGAQPLSWAGPANESEGSPRFNNVAGMIRGSVMREVPFPDVSFGEDSAWASQVIAQGWRVAFVADAVVRHAHRYTPSQAFRRYRTDAAFHRLQGGRRLRPSIFSVCKGLLYELRQDLRYVRSNGAPLRELVRAPFLRLAQVLGQYSGSRGPLGPRVEQVPTR